MAYYARARSNPLATLLFAVYVAVGIIIANSHGYFRHVTDIKSFISAVLAVILWPLVLGHVNLHLR
jgi:hypothetical protein